MKTMMIALMVLIAASAFAIDPITDGSVPEGFEDVELTGYVDFDYIGYRWEDRDLSEKVLLQTTLIQVFRYDEDGYWGFPGPIESHSW